MGHEVRKSLCLLFGDMNILPQAVYRSEAISEPDQQSHVWMIQHKKMPNYVTCQQ